MSIQSVDIFKAAARSKLRFSSPRGELNIEQLWDVPLRSKDEFNLDTVAKLASRSVKATSEESFVETKKTAQQTQFELALEVVKNVIATKLEEEKALELKAANKQEKDKLLKILAEKQDGKLSELSENELKKRIAALEN